MRDRHPGLRRPPHAGLHRQRGGTFIGILIGIVIGLAIAVVAALFVTRADVPFIGAGNRPPDRPVAAAPADPASLPDPNRSGGVRVRPAPAGGSLERPPVAPVVSAEAPAPVPPPQQPVSQQQLPQQQPNRPGAAVPPRAAGTSPPPAGGAPIEVATPSSRATTTSTTTATTITPANRPAPAPAAQVATAPSSTRGEPATAYLLQAGAYRSPDDADGMKAKLALMGIEAQVVAADVNGTTLHRVRVGPYVGLDAMNRARARLAENGIEATVLRQR
jgi:cell division protein FtsN